jgi:hypothetical protein
VNFVKSLALRAAIAALFVPLVAAAASPEIRIPDYRHLRAKASETVEVSVGGFLLGIARALARKEAENDPDLRLLEDIKSVNVRSFKFEEDEAYSKADVDAVRRQLDSPQWNAIAQIHKREPREDVDVYICVEDGKACGITVIAAQARELTFVNIVGSIDIDRLAELHGEFGIPDLSQAQ